MFNPINPFLFLDEPPDYKCSINFVLLYIHECMFSQTFFRNAHEAWKLLSELGILEKFRESIFDSSSHDVYIPDSLNHLLKELVWCHLQTWLSYGQSRCNCGLGVLNALFCSHLLGHAVWISEIKVFQSNGSRNTSAFSWSLYHFLSSIMCNTYTYVHINTEFSKGI